MKARNKTELISALIFTIFAIWFGFNLMKMVLDTSLSIAIIAGTILFGLVIFALTRMIVVKRVREKRKKAANSPIINVAVAHKETNSRAICGTLSVFIFVAGIVLRVVFFLMDVIIFDDSISAAAQIGSTISISGGVVSTLYAQLLHGLFYLVGNHTWVAFAYSLLFQVILGCVWYVVVDTYMGIGSSFLWACFWSFMPFMFESGFGMYPETFLLIIAGIYLLAIHAGRNYARGGMAATIFAGILAGALSACDFRYCILALFFFGYFVSDEEIRASKKALRFILSVVLAGAAYFGVFVLRGYFRTGVVSVKSVSELICNSVIPYQLQLADGLPCFEVASKLPSLAVSIGIVIMLICFCFAIPGLFSSHVSCGTLFLNIPLVALGVSAVILATPESDYSIFTLIFLASVLQCGIAESYANIVKIPDEISESSSPEELMKAPEQSREEEKPAELKFPKVDPTPGEVVSVQVGEETREVKLLDNPLRVPPKKEHKEMEYDIEVSDDDDYDF